MAGISLFASEMSHAEDIPDCYIRLASNPHTSSSRYYEGTTSDGMIFGIYLNTPGHYGEGYRFVGFRNPDEVPERVVIPEKVRFIPQSGDAEVASISVVEYSFSNCKNLKEIVLDCCNDLNCFSECESLESIVYRGGSERITGRIISSPLLKSIKFGEYSEFDCVRAFASCPSLERLELMGGGQVRDLFLPESDVYGWSTQYSSISPGDWDYNDNKYYRDYFSASFYWFGNMAENAEIVIPFKYRAQCYEVDYYHNGLYKMARNIRIADPENTLTLEYSLNYAGELVNKINLDDVLKVRSIKLSGPINGVEMAIIKKMKNIETIDLSDTRIVEGGLPGDCQTQEGVFQKDYLEGLYPKRVLMPKVSRIESLPEWPLEEFRIPEGVESMGTIEELHFLQELEIPSSVTEIGELYHLSSLKRLVIPDNVKSVGTIGGCPQLEELVYGKGIESVPGLGKDNFCRKLKKVVMSENVKDISGFLGYNAYGNDRYCLDDVYLPVARAMQYPETIHGTNLYVPKGFRNTYLLCGWNEGFSNIIEMDDSGIEDTEATERGIVQVEGRDIVPVGFQEGTLMAVYSLDGASIYSGLTQRIQGLSAGIYIVTVGNDFRAKVIVR